MRNSGNSLQVAKLVYIFTLMPALLLLSTDSAAQSITNPRIRGMSTMQDPPQPSPIATDAAVWPPD